MTFVAMEQAEVLFILMCNSVYRINELGGSMWQNH